MSLKLYYHPLASYCHKALIALYELDLPFEPVLVDLGDPADRDAFLTVWPMGQFPVLRDEAAGRTLPESTIIVEYLDRLAGGGRLLPADPDAALYARLADRFHDLHVQEPMQKIVTDRIRPAGQNDPFGVEAAKRRLATAYDVIERDMAGREWAAGEAFSMADCAAAPALFYAQKVLPFGERPNLAAYHRRLLDRPSYARTLREAEPYFRLFPG